MQWFVKGSGTETDKSLLDWKKYIKDTQKAKSSWMIQIDNYVCPNMTNTTHLGKKSNKNLCMLPDYAYDTLENCNPKRCRYKVKTISQTHWKIELERHECPYRLSAKCQYGKSTIFNLEECNRNYCPLN
ncbi:hypothetical protein [Methanohalophilus profundi]|uniref:hypothetical protein n=1 Tax=Methanohalophilus profundi TaxID=2138083 RepID=UPI00101E0327|nr:hypothetical protein [Methanohalophilus profundi]